MEKKCLECGIIMKVKPSHCERKKYCSRICKKIYQKKYPPISWKKLSKKKDVECTNCKKKFLRKPSEIGRNNYCSRECRNSFLRKNKNKINQHLKKRVQVKCLSCYRLFSVIESRKNTAKYCSRSCLGKANGLRGEVQYKKRVKVKCNNCLKTINKKPSVVRKWNFCSEKCMGEFYAKSGAFAGRNSGTWNGGDIGYYGPNWREQRRKVRKRDKYICQDCGITEKEYGRELSVHHIIPFRKFKGDWKKANQLENLVTLCEYPCHRKRHSKNTESG